MDWGHESEKAKVVERFEDLPRVRDADEARRVHNAAGVFFLSKALVAHETFTCMHVVEIETVVDKPRWRVATAPRGPPARRQMVRVVLRTLGR